MSSLNGNSFDDLSHDGKSRLFMMEIENSQRKVSSKIPANVKSPNMAGKDQADEDSFRSDIEEDAMAENNES